MWDWKPKFGASIGMRRTRKGLGAAGALFLIRQESFTKLTRGVARASGRPFLRDGRHAAAVPRSPAVVSMQHARQVRASPLFLHTDCPDRTVVDADRAAVFTHARQEASP
ncbi:hypothetical protein [Burkholderia cenocepacia]|uniref:hypothetical protein n=1 Tax=Burkholderia cenocepacia TaxID=95486 RepID=UPI00209A7AA0|nr:hypothetical protein [Burkholderia cenocepacia]